MEIQDERIIQERRKIQSVGFEWVIYILLAAVIIQQFFMRAPFEQYAVEFFVMLGCEVYNIIACYRAGVDIWASSKQSGKKILINTVLTAAGSTVMLVILSGSFSLKNSMLYFVTFTICAFAFKTLMTALNKRKKKRIDSALDNDNDE